MRSSWSSPAPPGKSKRRTPASSPPCSVPRTVAGLPSRSSAQVRIASWSVVVLASDISIAYPPRVPEHPRVRGRAAGPGPRLPRPMERRHPATTAVFGLCVLWSLAVLVQIFLAGIGIGELGGKSIDPHKTLGGILHAGTAIILIAALISPSRRRDGPLALGLLVLVTVQITLIDASGAGL